MWDAGMMHRSLSNMMSPSVPLRRGHRRRRRALRNTAVVRCAFVTFAATADAAGIALSAFAAVLLHYLIIGDAGLSAVPPPLSVEIGVLFMLQTLYGADYALPHYLDRKGHVSDIFLRWNIAFLLALAIGFATRSTGEVSRGAVLLFYAGGGLLMVLIRLSLVTFVREASAAGHLATRRVLLVGHEELIERFMAEQSRAASGSRIEASFVLRGSEETSDEDRLAEDVALATAAARVLQPDDVCVLLPWSEREAIDACLDAFVQVPAAIHVAPERMLERTINARIARIGPVASLQVARGPLTSVEVVSKRLIDIAGAGLGLALLAPLLLAVAVLIKCDSRGPVLFRQRRYGFNRQPFRILKFRTMTTLDDGAVVRQVERNDRRVTRVGAWLRRSSIDELPQLLNVLRGEMSLVGPRPHALAHDAHYENRIALYARRHNVKPGITGWAQVNGFRGETATDEKMRGRVAHDLHYIDHWSLWLDIRIIVLTFVSAKTFRNAY